MDPLLSLCFVHMQLKLVITRRRSRVSDSFGSQRAGDNEAETLASSVQTVYFLNRLFMRFAHEPSFKFFYIVIIDKHLAVTSVVHPSIYCLG